MFVDVVANAAAPAGGGGFAFDPFTLILLALFAFLIFSMFRRQKKAQKTLLEQQSKIGPGVEVMTQFGLFGTVVSVDNDENKVVLEISPGNQATVHLQTVTKVITADAVPAEDEAEDVSGTGGATAVTRDSETLTGGAADPTVETPEETLARLNKDKKNNES